MSHHYKYDETGLPSSYLSLIIALMPFIYLMRKYLKKTQPCFCSTCKSLRKPKSRIIPTTLIILSIFISYFIFNIATIKIKHNSLYDPYEVLNLQQDASINDIKKAFKKIVKQNDPDKVEGEERERINEYLFKVGKAYNLLRDKKRLTKFNSVSKETEEVVAIPQSVIENGWFLFFIYVAVLCGLVPLFGFKKWKNSIGCNRLGIKYSSVDHLYKKSKNDLLGKENITGIRNIIHLLCEIDEIKEIKTAKINKWVKLELIKLKNEAKEKELHESSKDDKIVVKIPKKIDESEEIKKFVKKHIEWNFAYPLKDTKNFGYFILMDYLFRTNIFSDNDKQYVVDKCIRSIEALKKIAIAKNLKDLLETIFTVDKMLHQAVFDASYSNLQYSGVKYQDLFLGKMKDKEDLKMPIIKIKEINAYVAKTNVGIEKESEPETSNENDNEETINDEFLSTEKTVSTISNVTSKVGVTQKVFKIEKESLTTIKVTLERESLNKAENLEEKNDFMMKMKGEIDLDLLNTLGKSIKTTLHSPYLPMEKTVNWDIIFLLNNKLLKTNPVFSDFEGKKDVYVEFESEKNGSGKLKIMVKCGQYFDLDVSEEIILEYY